MVPAVDVVVTVLEGSVMLDVDVVIVGRESLDSEWAEALRAFKTSVSRDSRW